MFFKALKQNLRIKTFVGTSPNALQIQIWTALIALLVLKYRQLRARFGWSLSNLAALLRQQLFVYRDLKRWPVDSSRPRREVLMITSGIDFFYGGGFSDPYVDATIHDAQCAGIPVFSIYTPAADHFGHAYWSAYWGQNHLFQLSEETGGESYYLLGPQAPVAFEPFLSKFSRQLRQQFFLTFLAKPEKKAATQSVRLSTEIHAVDMIAADRVCVPAAPGR